MGQNVNSYRDTSECNHGSIPLPAATTQMSVGFKTVYKPKKGGMRFADLLERVASIDPEVRIRFTSPHPKDFPDEVPVVKLLTKTYRYTPTYMQQTCEFQCVHMYVYSKSEDIVVFLFNQTLVGVK